MGSKIDTHIRIENTLEGIEDELRIKKRRINKMDYAFRVAFGQLQCKIDHYPTEMGQTRYTISRDLTALMNALEYYEAIRNGLRG